MEHDVDLMRQDQALVKAGVIPYGLFPLSPDMPGIPYLHGKFKTKHVIHDAGPFSHQQIHQRDHLVYQRQSPALRGFVRILKSFNPSFILVQRAMDDQNLVGGKFNHRFL
jgi:hypothetical protein